MRTPESTPTPTARRRTDVISHAAAGRLMKRALSVSCPVCGWRFDVFKDDWNRPRALCWRCGSHERHRAQMLLLTHRPQLLSNASDLLHFAPEWCLQRRLQATAGLRYVTADLYMEGADLTLDLQAIDLPDASYDAVICSHVLEHVPDDRAAMRELARIVRPGGWVLVMVPLDLTRAEIYEDPSITDPTEREHHFWQFDHVRLYAPDIETRLSDAGFAVEVIRPCDEFGEELFMRAGLADADYMWLCRPR
jgi:SAM-dependent methyltransferase